METPQQQLREVMPDLPRGKELEYITAAVVGCQSIGATRGWLEKGGLQRQQEAVASLLTTVERHRAGEVVDRALYRVANELREALP